MATTFFIGRYDTVDSTPPGSLTPDADRELRLGVRDVGILNTLGSSTEAGPTGGVPIAGAQQISWWTEPLAAVTISGTVTINLWMSENNMSANVGAHLFVERADGSGNVISTVIDSEKGTELPVTTRAAQNWTATPTSTTLSDGDRLRLRVLGNDVGTMASGFSFDFSAGASSAGVDGDSFVTFTETITLLTGGAAARKAYNIVQTDALNRAFNW